MTAPSIRNSVIIGIAASLAIILFQVSDILLVYKYFKFDYYISAVAILFLIAGFLISKNKQPNTQNDNAGEALLQNLTGKELSILQLITEGKSNKEIAALNFVEVSTIKTHINNIYSKLDLSNRREAIHHFKGKL